jgi:hypothetical protein
MASHATPCTVSSTPNVWRLASVTMNGFPNFYLREKQLGLI